MSRTSAHLIQHPITYFPTGDLSADFRHALEEFEVNLARVLPADVGARILDVGCGWGQFLYWLRQKGYTAAGGIDIGAEQERHGRSLGLSVERVEDSAEYLRGNAGAFDLITLHHVIEHMPAPAGLELLRAARAALRPGGRVVVQTPNMAALSAAVIRYVEVTHVTGYTESSIKELLELAGFRVTEVFGNRAALRWSRRRLGWAALQYCSRLLWRLMLVGELGTDAPRVLAKNLFAVAEKE